MKTERLKNKNNIDKLLICNGLGISSGMRSIPGKKIGSASLNIYLVGVRYLKEENEFNK